MATPTVTTSAYFPPLTTTFTPPAGCSSPAWLMTTEPYIVVPIVPSGNSTQTWKHSVRDVLLPNTRFESSSLDCRPNGGVYSPGLICPEGWTVARTSMTTYYGNSVGRQNPVTWMPCCPRYVLCSSIHLEGELYSAVYDD